MAVALVTGSGGLIGSEAVRHFAGLGLDVVGIDNDMRQEFFGAEASTAWNVQQLTADLGSAYSHHGVDIRDRDSLGKLFQRYGKDIAVVIHTAAQPSHDWAVRDPFTDFDVNAGGTLNMLQNTREHCIDAAFIHCSTNKVYGDTPNRLPLIEQETRWELDPAHPYANGITEDMSIDHCLHSVFGASKVAADVMAQEYGRYFGMKTACLRCGCLTGPNHAGVELHGFLSYLVKAQLQGRTYRIFGHLGKQVRDNIHSLDVARAVEAIYRDPRPGEVYNLGGGRDNSCSILEAFDRVEQLAGREMTYEYREQARQGDHICYISDLAKMKAHHPGWAITKPLDAIFEEIVAAWRGRLADGGRGDGDDGR